jgi:hypothetical protein
MNLSARFEGFAEWCDGTSPLYECISRGVASDADLLSLAEEVPSERSPPHVLLAAVHSRLLADTDHPLADYYPSVTDDPAEGDPFPAFRDFCAEYEDELLPVLHSRRTQTNAVRRCTVLFPAFSHISREVGGEPLALVELGPSAGLNLCWNRYAYDYGDVSRYGTGEFALDSEIRGGSPPLPDEFPPVASRVGIDLNPLDVRDEADVLWLCALVWPEHGDRHRLLAGAAEIAQRHPPDLRQGDAVESLPDVLREIPNDVPVCVFDTQMRYQLPESAQERLAERIEEAAERRTLHWLSGHEAAAEWDNALTLWWFDGEEYRRLAAYEQHGKWLRWLP